MYVFELSICIASYNIVNTLFNLPLLYVWAFFRDENGEIDIVRDESIPNDNQDDDDDGDVEVVSDPKASLSDQIPVHPRVPLDDSVPRDIEGKYDGISVTTCL